MNRMSNSIRNITVAVLGQGIGLLITLIARFYFVRYLSTEYLGIHGLFSNILAFLSLADLGIGGAMIFSLYKPVAEDDKKKITLLMQYYKRIYTLIAVAVFLLGISVLPFLTIFIKDMPNINENIYLIFFLYILNSASTYLFTYKRSLIIANQNEYISTIFVYSKLIIVNIAQIFILVYTQNFILFLSIQFIFNFIENIFISQVAKKMYPFIKIKTNEKLDKKTLKSITKNMKAMIIHKVGTLVIFNTDNIILSYYIGIGIVGLYSNYLLIVNAAKTLLGQLFSSITASIGNLIVLEDQKVIKSRFLVVNFLGFWIYGLCSISLFILLNPFIELWIGNDYLFEMPVILVIAINFYFTGMRQATLTFRTAMGLFWQDRYKPVLESVVNLVVSLILVKYLGIVGVLIGTLASTLFVCTWVEPIILYKHGFKQSSSEYFQKYFYYTFIGILAALITKYVISLVIITGYWGFLMKLFVCMIIPNLFFVIIFYKTKEFKFISNLFFKMITVKFNRTKLT